MRFDSVGTRVATARPPDPAGKHPMSPWQRPRYRTTGIRTNIVRTSAISPRDGTPVGRGNLVAAFVTTLPAMNLNRTSTWRFLIYTFALVLVVVGIFWWFIPALKAGDVKAPFNSETGFHSQCINEPEPDPLPSYGDREPVSYCTTMN